MQKIKLFIESEDGKDILTVLVIVLVGLGSFQLGRLSMEDTRPGIEVEYLDLGQNQTGNAYSGIDSAISTISAPRGNTEGEMGSELSMKSFFASNRGKKYYSVHCSAGKNIKMENRVYFGTREEAESAGYELSSSCR